MPGLDRSDLDNLEAGASHKVACVEHGEAPVAYDQLGRQMALITLELLLAVENTMIIQKQVWIEDRAAMLHRW